MVARRYDRSRDNAQAKLLESLPFYDASDPEARAKVVREWLSETGVINETMTVAEAVSAANNHFERYADSMLNKYGFEWEEITCCMDNYQLLGQSDWRIIARELGELAIEAAGIV